MTPEEIKQKARIIKEVFNDEDGLNVLVHAARCVDELEEAAIRLSAIKAAGDEEVEKIFAELERLYPNAKTSFMSLQSIVKYERLKTTRVDSEIADLRAKLGEAKKERKESEDWFRVRMSKDCPKDEKHCACVPDLEAALKESYELISFLFLEATESFRESVKVSPEHEGIMNRILERMRAVEAIDAESEVGRD